MLRKLWTIIKHPVTALVFGFLVATFFHIINISKIEPQYTISQPEEIISPILKDSDLKIIWKDKEIQKLVSVKVAFWNAGKQYFKNDDIVPEKPITIVPSFNNICKKIRIVDTDIVQTSRDGLNFNYEVINEQYIKLEIDGGEAVEQDDGFVMRILYEGLDSCGFEIMGRIYSTEIKKFDWNNVVRNDKKISFQIQIFVICVIFILFLICFLFIIYSFIESQRLIGSAARNQQSSGNIPLVVGISIIVITFIILSTLFATYIIPEINRGFFPSWIK